MADGIDDDLGAPTRVPTSGFRHRMRSNPATRQPYRIAVFVLGLLFVALGIGLAALPGPLTIPPVLIGLYIWSTEFLWAERLFDRFQVKGQEAWEHAKKHPRSSAAITVGGLAMAGAVFWAVGKYDLVEKARDAVGV